MRSQTDSPAVREIYLPDLVGRGYGRFWRFRGRYRVVKGSRASKKSKTAALWFITNLMAHPQANLLVIRKVGATLKDSCFSDLCWAINRLGVAPWWITRKQPLEMVYLPTGQKILFRGLDDPFKIASISVESGSLCWGWVEEAFEILKAEDFDMLDESIRGQTPPGLYKQWTLTLNPWNERHWIKRRFFDAEPSDQILALTTNYLCNEWLDDADRKVFETMKQNNPRRYKVAGLGEWGSVEGLIYDRWREESFDRSEIAKRPGVVSVFGLDFGYTADPTALFCGLYDAESSRLWVFDELYQRGLTNKEIAARLEAKGYSKERITADSAEPKSIDELRTLGVRRIKGARKGRDSVNNGIQFLQNLEIIISPSCVNFLTEIVNYAWQVDKWGQTLNRPAEGFDHLMDAMRYALEGAIRGPAFSFN